MKQTAFDGVAEICWESFESIEVVSASESGQIAGALLAEDETNFTDLEASSIFFIDEHEIVSLD